MPYDVKCFFEVYEVGEHLQVVFHAFLKHLSHAVLQCLITTKRP